MKFGIVWSWRWPWPFFSRYIFNQPNLRNQWSKCPKTIFRHTDLMPGGKWEVAVLSNDELCEPDITDSDRIDFRCRRVVDSSSFILEKLWSKIRLRRFSNMFRETNRDRMLHIALQYINGKFLQNNRINSMWNVECSFFEDTSPAVVFPVR